MIECELEKLTFDIQRTRKHLLDLLETTYGHRPNWEAVRRFVLQAFGSNGLEGTVNAIRNKLKEERNETDRTLVKNNHP